MARKVLWFVTMTALYVAACGDDGGGDPSDANPSVDSAASGSTACPPTPGLMCDTASELCVVSGPIGPTDTSACEPVPNGCEADRTCACAAAMACPSPSNICTDTADNTIYCDNGTQ